MKTYYMIAGVLILVETPFELVDSNGFAGYRIMPNDDSDSLLAQRERAYYEIRFMETDAFPAIEGKVLFQDEMKLFLDKEGQMLCFFRIPYAKRPAAWCEIMDGRMQTIYYRSSSVGYFRNTIGCFNAASFESIMYSFGKYLFHCSYVDIGGEAVLFSAHSGGGKTTHALLWEKCGLGEVINGDRAVIERVTIVDDEEGVRSERNNNTGFSDKKVVKINTQTEIINKRVGTRQSAQIRTRKFIIHGLPIAGSSDIFKNRSLPLKAIFMLEKASVNEIIDISPAKQFLQILEQITVHTWEREYVSDAADFVTELIKNIPVKLLRCRPDEGAVKAVRNYFETAEEV